jgi:GxxExxY protein
MEDVHETRLRELSQSVIGSCIDVHKALGPGLLESIYVDLLCYDLELKQIPFIRESPVKIIYKGNEFNTKLRTDLIVDSSIILELKSVKEMAPIFETQIMTYMKLTNIELGLLINFNVPLLKDGIQRFRLNYGKQN